MKAFYKRLKLIFDYYLLFNIFPKNKNQLYKIIYIITFIFIYILKIIKFIILLSIQFYIIKLRFNNFIKYIINNNK